MKVGKGIDDILGRHAKGVAAEAQARSAKATPLPDTKGVVFGLQDPVVGTMIKAAADANK